MAAIRVPRPGTEFGPCPEETCGYGDCEAAREQAVFTRGVCERPIGYERMHYPGTEEYGDARHSSCFIRAVEGAPAGAAS